MKILFCTNVPSPYRVDFFNELGKQCDLTVCFERESASDRNQMWKASKKSNYNDIFLDLKPVGTDRSRGNALKNYIKNNCFDIIILTNYVSPASMEAIVYCRLKKIPYWIEYDGGFNKAEWALKKLLKKFLLVGAKGHLTTCCEHIEYLNSLGIDSEKIFKYPFTSIGEKDLIEADAIINYGKQYYKDKISIKEKYVVLAIGQFIYRKGFDILIPISKQFSEVGFYFVGGEPTEEYIKLVERIECKNVHFVGFKTKDEIAEYYGSADVFVLPTREDIWGLVINEAMAYGLPVVTTEKCIAGLELVKNGENGYIVPSEDGNAIEEAINTLINNSELRGKMGNNSRQMIKEYTIEKMAKRHMDIFRKN